MIALVLYSYKSTLIPFKLEMCATRMFVTVYMAVPSVRNFEFVDNRSTPYSPSNPLFIQFVSSEWVNGLCSIFSPYSPANQWTHSCFRTPNYVDDVLHAKVSSLVYANLQLQDFPFDIQ